MLVRVAVVAGTCVLGAVAAKAEELGPEQARAFVVGKLFSYTCFDGTVGMGRIFAKTARWSEPSGPAAAARCGLCTCRTGRCGSRASSMCAHLSKA